jgi:multidrug efflux pump subunit AcrA (membrane-fusion protein)
LKPSRPSPRGFAFSVKFIAAGEPRIIQRGNGTCCFRNQRFPHRFFLRGNNSRIGADISRENKTSPSYFTVRIALRPEELAKLGKVRLLPGMPVEVFISTSERTLLSYLVKPLADQVHRAFREK